MGRFQYYKSAGFLCVFWENLEIATREVFFLLLLWVFFSPLLQKFLFSILIVFFLFFFGYFEITVSSNFCLKYGWLKYCPNFCFNWYFVVFFSPSKFLQNISEFKYCCFSSSIFENIVEICGPTFKIQGFSLYGNLYYWDIARTFPVQKSCAAFFAGTDSCLFTFSNGTKTCLFVFAGALKRPIGKNKKKFQFHSKK